jgi:hypothetical protein
MLQCVFFLRNLFRIERGRKKRKPPVHKRPTVSSRVRVSLAIKPLVQLLAVNSNADSAGVGDFYGSTDVANGIASAESRLVL